MSAFHFNPHNAFKICLPCGYVNIMLQFSDRQFLFVAQVILDAEKVSRSNFGVASEGYRNYGNDSYRDFSVSYKATEVQWVKP